MSKLYCSELEYGLGVSLDKFDLGGFKKDIERIDRSGRLAGGQRSISAVAPTRDRSSADYHVHFNCHWTKREFRASLEYYPETESRTPDDTGPFAEEMFSWIGKFFKNGNATAYVSVTFSYPEKKRSVLFPPMHMRISLSREVEVVGMVMRIPSRPQGVYEAFVTLNGSKVVVILQATRPVTFRSFNVYDDVTALAEVAGMFAREINR